MAMTIVIGNGSYYCYGTIGSVGILTCILIIKFRLKKLHTTLDMSLLSKAVTVMVELLRVLFAETL